MKATIRLGDVCEVLNGFAFKSDNYVDSGIRIIRIANVQKGFIEDSTPAFYPINSEGIDRFMLDEGDLLMSLTGNVGRVAILAKEFLPAALNQRVACLRMKPGKVIKRYLFHILNSDFFEQQCIQASKGVAQKNMSTEWLKDFEIPLYSLEEQKAIIAILDNALQIIEERKRQLSILDTLIKARFVEMFGDPMTNDKGYELKRYGDVFELNAGGTPSKTHPEYWEGGTISWIGSNMCQDRYIYENDGKFITQEGYDNSSARLFPIDTVLVALVGATIGKTALLKFETTTNQNVLGIRGIRESGYVPEFVYYYTQGLYKKFIGISDGGFSMASKGFISELPIPVVPLALQEEFTSFAEQVDKSKVVVQKALDEAQLLFDSLMQKYFG